MTEEKAKSNVIYVGSKKIGSYLLAIDVQLEKENQDSVKIVGRGKNVARVIDLTAIEIRKETRELGEVKISTETFKPQDRDISVSVIEITINKVKGGE